MNQLLKDGDRVEIIKPKMTWNGKKFLAKVGQKATVHMDEDRVVKSYSLYILIDGHKKGMWILPSCLKKIED